MQPVKPKLTAYEKKNQLCRFTAAFLSHDKVTPRFPAFPLYKVKRQKLSVKPAWPALRECYNKRLNETEGTGNRG